MKFATSARVVSRIFSLDLYSPEPCTLAVPISDSANFMRSEYRTPSRRVDCPLLFSVATKRVTISGQRDDLYKRIRCRGNVFQLAVV
jgi:hypothetical protein